MNRYEVQIESSGRAQSYSTHRTEDNAVARMDEIARAPWVTRACVIERDSTRRTVIARAERDAAGRITRWRRTWKT